MGKEASVERDEKGARGLEVVGRRCVGKIRMRDENHLE